MSAATTRPTPATTKVMVDFHALALEVMFTGKVDYRKHGLGYRKGKTLEDVRKALSKARDVKNGHARTETELSMLELYLGHVFLQYRQA
jgi:hypothetical protein